VLEIEQPYHPLGLRDAGSSDTGGDGTEDDGSVFTSDTPSYADVLAARADRVGLVGDFLATVTADELAAPRKNPHAPEYPETVRSCLHVILEEEWEHLRFAVRDLDAIEATSGGS